MPFNKKSFLKAIFTSRAGCGCGKKKAKASLHVHQPKPITETCMQEHPISCIACPSSTTLSYNMESHTMHVPKKFGDSVAIVKDTNDPYEDFRESMLQMIGEKEIYSKDGLEELLKCFLDLNLPCHHDVIVEAFTEIWNEVMSEKPTVRKSAY